MAEQLQEQTTEKTSKTSGVKRSLDQIHTERLSKQPKPKRRRLCNSQLHAPPKKYHTITSIHQLDEDEMAECTKSIQTTMTVSHTTRMSLAMNSDVVTAARKYYLHIVNDMDTTFAQKKDKIYDDLVIGSQSDITLKEDEVKTTNDAFELN
eukprot:211074_1